MLKENETHRLDIIDLGKDGEGIGKIDGIPLFVPGALPGDIVRARITKMKKAFGFAALVEIIEPSPHRITPKCRVAGLCGGCSLQALSYGEQLRLKTKIVRDALERIGGFQIRLPGEEKDAEHTAILHEILGMDEPYYYRNKAQYAVGESGGNPVIGFYSAKTHDPVEAMDCNIQHPKNKEILHIVRQYIIEEKLSPVLLRGVMIRSGKATGQFMVCLAATGEKLPHTDSLIQKLSAVPGVKCIALSIRKSVQANEKIKILWGENIEDTIGTVLFSISPQSFFQVNPAQTERLYQKALDFAALSGNETLIDLYCGIGTISLFFARHAKKVVGVEIVEAAVHDARINAHINGIANTEFLLGATETVLPVLYEKENLRADVLVVDPPRKGCDSRLLETALKMRPKKIIYLSCDPATLARDLKILCRDQYRLTAVQPVDMFPQTGHVETVVLLEKSIK